MNKTKNNSKCNRTIITAAAVLLFVLVPFSSCRAQPPEGLNLDNKNLRIRPGHTATLTAHVIPADDKKFSAAVIKDFSGAPGVTLNSPGFRLLDIKTLTTPEGISAECVILAEETLLSGAYAEISLNWGGFSSAGRINVRKDTASRLGADGVITDPADYDALINKQRRLPAGYIPEDLVRVDVPTILAFEEVNHLRKDAADALKEMFEAAETEKGFSLVARSGYRSYKTQVSLYQSNVNAHGQEYADRFSAKPGTSEHQSGLAMDITSPGMNYQLEQSFGETPEGIWVRENAHRFGFIIRYPEGKEKITGYSYEPWHLRYLGKDLASEIFSRGLTLEEYYTD